MASGTQLSVSYTDHLSCTGAGRLGSQGQLPSTPAVGAELPGSSSAPGQGWGALGCGGGGAVGGVEGVGGGS